MFGYRFILDIVLMVKLQVFREYRCMGCLTWRPKAPWQEMVMQHSVAFQIIYCINIYQPSEKLLFILRYMPLTDE